jgi:hypothetical protein
MPNIVQVHVTITKAKIQEVLTTENIFPSFTPPASGSRIMGLLLKMESSNTLVVGRMLLNSNGSYTEQYSNTQGQPYQHISLSGEVSNEEQALYENFPEFELVFFPQAEVQALVNYTGSGNQSTSGILVTRSLAYFPIKVDENGDPLEVYETRGYRNLRIRPSADPLVNGATAAAPDRVLAMMDGLPCPPTWERNG